jgi:flavodoxin
VSKLVFPFSFGRTDLGEEEEGEEEEDDEEEGKKDNDDDDDDDEEEDDNKIGIDTDGDNSLPPVDFKEVLFLCEQKDTEKTISLNGV